jgi:tetratricopeptide (TPR) repeat protein
VYEPAYSSSPPRAPSEPAKPAVVNPQNAGELPGQCDPAVHPNGSGEAQPEDLSKQLGELVALLRKAYPEAKPSWFDPIYEKVKSFANYVGIPGLIIAAILPVYTLVASSIDYLNKIFVESVYTSYATDLLSQGETERADKVLADLDYAQKHDVKTLYTNAKILTQMAIKQGKRQQEATDRSNILLRLQKGKTIFFPKVGKRDEIFDLELGLADIDIQLQGYKSAEDRLEKLRVGAANKLLPDQDGQILLRKGTIAVLQFRTDDAKSFLDSARSKLDGPKEQESLAECNFQLGKLYQFLNDDPTAEKYYLQARKTFESQADNYSLLKVYNNLGMLYLDAKNDAMAKYNFVFEQHVARTVGDEESAARALINLAIVAKNQGSLEEALRLALEANQAFQKQAGNKLGMAAAAVTLSGIYFRKGDYAKALSEADESLAMFIDIRELRGAGTSLALLGHSSEMLGNWGEEIYYYTAALKILSGLGSEKIEAGRQNLATYRSSLAAVQVRLGTREYDKLVEQAKPRLNELYEQLGILSSNTG